LAIMPEKAKVGPFIYSLIEDDGPLVLNGRTCTGTQSSEKQEIRLLTGRALQRRQQTFVHEILHAIHNYRGFEPSKNDSETISHEFGRGFLLVAKQNPELINWLIQDTDEDIELAKVTEIPLAVRIGVYVYTLQSKDLIIRNECEVVGNIEYSKQTITYSPNRGLHMIQSTLMFHIFEAIFDYRNINVDDNKDTEIIVDEAAYGLLLFIKQNPEFLSWLINN
jgi:hypothetical protein